MYVPIAMSCAVWPVAVIVWLPGVTVSAVSIRLPVAAVTVTFDVPVTIPKAPCMLAEMAAVPADTPVANPPELTVATAGFDDCHLACVVTSAVVLA